MTSVRRVVIVGAGLAGLRAGQELRAKGFDGDLFIVGDEKHMPYNRPPLSKQVLTGATAADACMFPTDGLDATWILGQPAVGLDPGGRAVRLGDGDLVPYDGLVIATGRRARPWPGLPEMAGFHQLRGLDDAIALREAIATRPRVAIIGAGFIGCEVAASLRQRGLDEVSLIDIAPHPMPALGPEVGTRAMRLHTEHGVRLHLSVKVAGFDGAGRVEAVRLADGTRIPADLVLLALGAVPNTEWLNGSGLTLHNGNVLCDAHCFAAGHRDIVAAGDVAAWPHPRAGGKPLHVEHWTNASDMARVAARNLLDPSRPEVYASVPSFWSDQYDFKIKSAGIWALAQQVTIVEDDAAAGVLVAEGTCDEGLVGALVVNKNKSFIAYKRRLAEDYRPPVDPRLSPRQLPAPI